MNPIPFILLTAALLAVIIHLARKIRMEKREHLLATDAQIDILTTVANPDRYAIFDSYHSFIVVAVRDGHEPVALRKYTYDGLDDKTYARNLAEELIDKLMESPEPSPDKPNPSSN